MAAIRSEIREFYGQINEIQMGARSAEKPLPKPESLVQYEMQVRLGIPMVAGGLMDQPYIWLLENQAVADEIALFEMVSQRNSSAPKEGA